jgi:DnaK suppressor protein
MSRHISKQQRTIREDLLRRREVLVRSGQQERRLLREGGERLVDTVQDAGDLSVIDLQTELDLSLLEIRTESIRLIDGAIRRIDAGIHGICDVCGGHITAARLKALPFAQDCVDCANDYETLAGRRRPALWGPHAPHAFV